MHFQSCSLGILLNKSVNILKVFLVILVGFFHVGLDSDVGVHEVALLRQDLQSSQQVSRLVGTSPRVFENPFVRQELALFPAIMVQHHLTSSVNNPPVPHLMLDQVLEDGEPARELSAIWRKIETPFLPSNNPTLPPNWDGFVISVPVVTLHPGLHRATLQEVLKLLDLLVALILQLFLCCNSPSYPATSFVQEFNLSCPVPSTIPPCLPHHSEHPALRQQL